jgi:hypothetical protein
MASSASRAGDLAGKDGTSTVCAPFAVLPRFSPSAQISKSCGSIQPVQSPKLGQNFFAGRHSPIFERGQRNLHTAIPRFLPNAEKMRKLPSRQLNRRRWRRRSFLKSQKNRRTHLWIYHAPPPFALVWNAAHER